MAVHIHEKFWKESYNKTLYLPLYLSGEKDTQNFTDIKAEYLHLKRFTSWNFTFEIPSPLQNDLDFTYVHLTESDISQQPVTPHLSYPIGHVNYFDTEHTELTNDFTIALDIPELDLNIGTYGKTRCLRKAIHRGYVPKAYFVIRIPHRTHTTEVPSSAKPIRVEIAEWHSIVIPANYNDN